ncbi:MAG: NAD kinase [Bacteroidota bacterium]|nr:NAD kinase [Bacteroidota bacterium]
MRIALFGKSVSEAIQPHIQQLIDKLESVDAEISIYASFYEKIKDHVSFKKDIRRFSEHRELIGKTDFICSIGGDGTFLDTLYQVQDSGIPIIGVNLGRLGFLSSVSRDEIDFAINCLQEGKFRLDQRTLLELEKPGQMFGDINYALNELTVSRKDSTSLILIHLYIDDKFLNSYWADGIIISTPTGSTAYSLSCGGPIITPGSENFVITPIATHNLTVRPIVIRDDSKIRIKLEGRDKAYFASLDSRSVSIDADQELLIKKCGFKINLVQLENKTFFTTIRDKLNWGLDIRN